jgi:hypothetical protein
MAANQVMNERRKGLPAPPLFVTAFSTLGDRHETLVEENSQIPDWFGKATHVRVAAPSGSYKDASLNGRPGGDIYKRCLTILGAEHAWAPEVSGTIVDSPIELEIWTADDAAVEITEGPVLETRRTPPKNGGDDTDTMPFYAVVRRKNGSAAYVASAGRIYLDVNADSGGLQYVPRALLDAGLAGAFWGFTEHHNPPAAALAAKRLLSVLFDPPSAKDKPKDPAWVAAAAHAVLTHRDLLPTYGANVIAALDTSVAGMPDSALLKALVGMARLAIGKGSKETVKHDVRDAVTQLSKQRAVYGETVRWLDAKFSVLSELMLRDLPDAKLKGELASIRDWLSKSYVGGQAAAYEGDAPYAGKDGWHDILAFQKKTLEF